MALAGPKAEINVVAPKAKPVEPALARYPGPRGRAKGDWKSELWKQQSN